MMSILISLISTNSLVILFFARTIPKSVTVSSDNFLVP